jgi:hypothetical protein
LTTNDVDDGSQVGPLLDQVAASVAAFTADGAYDQEGVSAVIAERRPEAAVIVPPRSTAVPSETAETEPTQRDRHLQFIAEHGRAAWQKASGYTIRARAEAAIGRFKQVIGDGLRPRTDQRRAIEVDARSPSASPEPSRGGGLLRSSYLSLQHGRVRRLLPPLRPSSVALKRTDSVLPR